MMDDLKIEPMTEGNFIEYLTGIFQDYGEDFSRLLCENKISIETERSITFELQTPFGVRELEIILKSE